MPFQRWTSIRMHLYVFSDFKPHLQSKLHPVATVVLSSQNANVVFQEGFFFFCFYIHFRLHCFMCVINSSLNRRCLSFQYQLSLLHLGCSRWYMCFMTAVDIWLQLSLPFLKKTCFFIGPCCSYNNYPEYRR